MSTISASTTSTTAYKVTADTTGTLVLQTGSTPTTAVTVGTDQSVTLAGALAVQSQNISPYTGFKNRIINGAMVIDQRNAGASVTPIDGQYGVDRWKFNVSQSSKFTAQQSSTAPSGFINSLLITSSSAYSVLSGDYFLIEQDIEGLNCSDLSWGSASASTVTFSFWVRSSLTGTFGGAMVNSGLNRSYPFSYTINSANTWEQKTVTIAGDQSGTWLTTNGVGIRVRFGLGVGSTYSGASGSWAAANYVTSTGATSVVGTNGATFYITGVQLEKGSTATSFDYRPYGTELVLCQRYYQTNMAAVGGAGSSTQCANVIPFVQQMRTTPTITLISGTSALDELYTSRRNISSLGGTWGENDQTRSIGVLCNTTGLTVQRMVTLQAGFLALSSEL